MPFPIPMDLPQVAQPEIVVDGRADESAWGDAMTVGQFQAYRPKPGVPASMQTSLKMMSSKEALYLHFTAEDDNPNRIHAGYGRRDSRRNDDYVGILIDTLGTGERGNLFIVNPLGVQLDGTLVRGRDQEVVPWRGGWSSWDARWESHGRLTEDGYEVEIAIPWGSVRHPEVVDSARVMAFRKVSRTAERSAWPALDPEIQGTLTQTTNIGGPGELGAGGGLTVLPEMTVTRTQDGVPDDRLGVAGIAAGGTVRYEPTPGLQMLATLNPDFSNVESDEAKIDVNSRYSLRYEEKRPFFLEGQEWFNHPIRNLIYTRSMVAPLAGVRATAESGKLAVAALHVWDNAPAPSVSEGDSWADEDLENKQSLATVGRFRYSLGRDSMVGGMISDKQILGTNMRHHLIGVDARLGLSERVSIEGAALASSTHGPQQDGRASPAMVLNQRVRTRHWKNRIEAKYLSHGFRTENGFEPIADWMSLSNDSEFHIFPSIAAIPRVFLTPAEAEVAWATDGEMRLYEWSPGAGFWTSNGAMFLVEGNFKGEEFADQWFDTRTVQAMGGASWTHWLRTWTNVEIGEGILYDEENPVVGQTQSLWLDVGVQPLTFFRVAPQLGWERFLDGGSEVYSGYVSRVKAEVFATPTLWARVIGDLSTFSGRRSYETLLAWEKSPGRAVYLGGHTSIETGTDDDPIDNPEREWTAFTKISWVFGG